MDSSKINYQPYLETLDKLGFCTFRVFNNGEIEKLLALYQRNFGDREISGLYANHNSTPIEQSLSISREIKDIIYDSLRPIFPDFAYFIGHFLAKGANVNKEFALHQDWNIVEESKYRSYQVWIPLQLTYPANGGMFVIPGSHNFLGNYRSGSYGIPVIPFDEKVKPLISNIIVPPSNALIYQNGLFHASHPNSTDKVRIAVIANLVEKTAPTFYFQKNEENNTTDLYSISGETLISHLPSLEKGIVDKDIPLAGSILLSSIENKRITSDTLVSGFQKKFGQINGSQIKQLHIALNAKLEQDINEMGYVVINLLDEQTIKVFKNEYFLRFGHIDRTPGRFTTLQHTDSVTKNQVHEFIVKNIHASLRMFFKDFLIPVSQFYIKKAFTSGDIDLHADSTLLLNHQLEPHYAVWVPLVDLDASMGTLSVIPGSHKISPAFFGGSFGGYHDDHLDWLRQFEVPLTLKAGQAVIFDNNLLHNSTSNVTAFDRLCFTFRITHMDSLYYSFLCTNPADDSLDLYEEDHNFYMTENWDGENKSPTGKYTGTFKNSRTKVKREELEEIFKSYQNRQHGPTSY